MTADVERFQTLLDYFETLYLSVGIADDVAAIRARGAVAGNMLGHAAAEAENLYAESARAFLIDAADGEVVYGAPLIGHMANAAMAPAELLA
jgi:hypothetical protein